MTNEEIDKELSKIEELDLILSKLKDEFSKSLSSQITIENIYDALYLELKEKYNFEHPTQLWDIDADFEKLKKILSNFDFKTVLFPVETSRNLIPKDYLVGYKISIKLKNLKWRIHKYDLDPFPSNPHAHLIDSNIKMDLTNGKCYKRKKYTHTISKKELLKIREKAQINFELPPLKFN
ncbi:hypothetical protein [Changchengzhania lutea]|uniref:hypothetical protein n=1 Tax=Changchengzhania lutea TaxID=2049305 RepID=UPI00115E4294|nr:hypothetical protein [Changchengzhania lutea]